MHCEILERKGLKKILVLSDTHGRVQRLKEIARIVKLPDLIIHCGDYFTDIEKISDIFGVEVIGVKGNCDMEGAPEERIIETEAGRILICHGHKYGVKNDVSRLYYRALEQGCHLAVFGHTHVPFVDEHGGVKFINPGSVSFPRNKTGGSYGMIMLEEESFTTAIVYCDTVLKNSTPKVSGGFVRNLINYSDRF